MPGERLPDEPMPAGPAAGEDPKAMVGRTFSAASATYDEVISFFQPFGRALVSAAEVHAGERVLDVGCGRGASLRPAAEAVGVGGSVVGVDLAQAMVERLRRELDADGISNAEVHHGDAEALEFPEARFDVVLGGFLVFFTPEPPKALAELHRVLRPGGRVALSIFDGPPGFPWHGDVVEELLGEAPIRPGDEYNKTSVLEPALMAVGFEAPVGTDVVEHFSFASADEVEAWQRSHAGRIVLDRLDELQLARYRGLLEERLEPHRNDEGFELVQRARILVAPKPS